MESSSNFIATENDSPKPATATNTRKTKAKTKTKAKSKKTKLAAVSSGDQTTTREGLNGPDPMLMKKQSTIWNSLMDRYFRLEIDGWDKLPAEPCLLIGVHSGGPLTMDAWTLVLA